MHGFARHRPPQGHLRATGSLLPGYSLFAWPSVV